MNAKCITVILAASTLLLTSGCKSREVLVYKTDTIEKYVTKIDTFRERLLQSDTVMLRDSVVLTVNQRGETITKYFYRDRWKTRVVHDTVTKVQKVKDVQREKSEEHKKVTSKKPINLMSILQLLFYIGIIVFFVKFFRRD